jgi:predicted MFS family arabinose efflux permease
VKVRIPLAITFVTAVFMIAAFFVPHYSGVLIQEKVQDWVRVIGGLALVLGIISLLQRHVGKILRKQRDWGYSIAAVVSFLVMSALGIFWGIKEKTAFNWVFNNIYAPLDATMFSLLAFFVASAAYRTFRARSVEAALLLLAALIVMFGRVPLGAAIWKPAPDVAEWIMSYPATAAKRAILLGVTLGGVAVSLRIILGIERSHLGGD